MDYRIAESSNRAELCPPVGGRAVDQGPQGFAARVPGWGGGGAAEPFTPFHLIPDAVSAGRDDDRTEPRSAWRISGRGREGKGVGRWPGSDNQ